MCKGLKETTKVQSQKGTADGHRVLGITHYECVEADDGCLPLDMLCKTHGKSAFRCELMIQVIQADDTGVSEDNIKVMSLMSPPLLP